MKNTFVFIAIIAVGLFAQPAAAGSYQGNWPNIGTSKVLDALQCSTQALHKPDQTWQCATTSSAIAGNQAAECLFVMVLSGEKVRWRLEGRYDQRDNWTGFIWRTQPACNTFLCNYVGQVWWSGRNTNLASYSYQWVSGNTADCYVSSRLGLFSGSY